MPKMLSLPAMLILMALGAARTVQCKEQGAAAVSIAGVGTLLAGRYDNSAQVAKGKATAENPAPQHVTVTIEPTQRVVWELWRVHMDVDPAVARGRAPGENAEPCRSPSAGGCEAG